MALAQRWCQRFVSKGDKSTVVRPLIARDVKCIVNIADDSSLNLNETLSETQACDLRTGSRAYINSFLLPAASKYLLCQR